MMETLEEKILRVSSEVVELEDYNPKWRALFETEKKHLIKCLHKDIIKRIEHFGSTAIPGMTAKPIIDILVEVTSLEETKKKVVTILESKGYEYFWRPSFDDNKPPYYCWFIKRNKDGKRTHHIHMVECNFEHCDRLYFRDYLIEKPLLAKEYSDLKISLIKEFGDDRISYTRAKTNFIVKITSEAKKYYNNA